ncbi:YbaB/EbfC family DNA-binding protein [Nocardia alni]|uniref:YbaB/EbfC family DNA-binding protein n=1 Tax=Nocardia alni TaxID=2815723 RepID=UPI001C24B3CA|nr:YbaB/EbfC family DNA-binding protein [Nocardia alni]
MSDLDQALTRLRTHSERLHMLSDRLRAIRAQESSPDGEIEIVVDGEGTPIELRLRATVSRMSPKEFERVLVATAERAARRAFGEHGQLIAEFNGTAPELVDSDDESAESTAARNDRVAAERRA